MAEVDSSTLWLRISEYLLSGSWDALIIAKAILEEIHSATGFRFAVVTPRYLRTVAQRCRELADALDEEALKLVEEFVNEE